MQKTFDGEEMRGDSRGIELEDELDNVSGLPVFPVGVWVWNSESLRRGEVEAGVVGDVELGGGLLVLVAVEGLDEDVGDVLFLEDLLQPLQRLLESPAIPAPRHQTPYQHRLLLSRRCPDERIVRAVRQGHSLVLFLLMLMMSVCLLSFV